ncbi:MAG: sugar ABC transporter permease [Crenarchaeota archaeon]|nr:sugar ABC transporter permease [Thermoproteota archaeon]
MMISPIAAALMWKQMLSSEWGIINFFIKSLGFEPVSFLVNARAALVSLAIIDIWQFTPFVFLILLSGLSSLSTEVFSAAKIDGASRWQTFRHVTFPLLTPFFLIALLLRTVDAFRVYDIVYVTTTGGPGIATETFSLNIYKIAFKILDVGYAAAVSMIMSWIAIIAITIYVRILRKNAKLQG